MRPAEIVRLNRGLYTAKDAARILDVPVHVLDRLIDDGLVQGVEPVLALGNAVAGDRLSCRRTAHGDNNLLRGVIAPAALVRPPFSKVPGEHTRTREREAANLGVEKGGREERDDLEAGIGTSDGRPWLGIRELQFAFDRPFGPNSGPDAQERRGRA